MTYEHYSAEWLVAHCDNESAFERAVKKQLARLLEENADYRHTCEQLIRQTCDQIGEITALKDRLDSELLQARGEAKAYKQAYFQLIEQVASGQALRAPPPILAKTPQSERRPLTNEAIDKIIKSNININNQHLYDAFYLCMRDVETAHDIHETGGEE